MSAQYVRAVGAETGASLLQSFRSPEFILPTLALPVAFYLLFGIVMAQGGPSTAAYLVATYGIFAVMGPAIFGFGTSVATERERGWLDLRRASPAPASGFILARLLTTIVFGAMALMPIYAAAGFLGGVALPRAAWFLLTGTHLLAVVPFSLLGLTIGFLFSSRAAVAVANLAFLLLAVLGGLWLPARLFPEVMQMLALALPSFHLAEVSLSVVDTAREHQPALHLAVAAAMTVLFALAAGAAWKRQERA
ncbi:MAG: ABC transporter permease [Pseudomonadota bacterium]